MVGPQSIETTKKLHPSMDDDVPIAAQMGYTVPLNFHSLHTLARSQDLKQLGQN